MKRHSATALSTVVVAFCAIYSALSLGAIDFMSNFEIFEGKPGVLSTLDHLAANWMLPLGGLFTTIFVGWFVKRKIAVEELAMKDENGNPTKLFWLWRFFICFIAPAAILAVIIAVIMGKDFS
jgi:NSS family neurotransmitter:Na+ symporter